MLNPQITRKMPNKRKPYFFLIVQMSLAELRQTFVRNFLEFLNGKITPNSAVSHEVCRSMSNNASLFSDVFNVLISVIVEVLVQIYM